MRDERGRYTNTVPIAESVPAWANGCPNCAGGIVAAPELTGVASIYLERMVHVKDKTIEFCTCRAGQSYYNSLRNRHQALVEEARRNPMMSDAARELSNPDILNTRAAMHAAYEAAPPPTIHAAEVRA